MLRKFLYTSMALLGLVTPLALTTATQAASPDSNLLAHCCYSVYYRGCHCECWQCYGCFDCSCEANQVANELRCQGYQVFVAHR